MNVIFIFQIFRVKNITLLYAQMKMFFKEVYCSKPRSSRQSSCGKKQHKLKSTILEAFIVCKNYSPPKDYEPNLKNPLLANDYGII